MTEQGRAALTPNDCGGKLPPIPRQSDHAPHPHSLPGVPGNSARPPREGQLRLARIGSIRIEAHLAAALLLRREQRPARLRSGGAEQRATAFGLVGKEDVLGAGMGIAVAPLQDSVAQ